MPIENMHFVPEHGLQIEETAKAGDKVGVWHLFRYWWAWLVAKEREPAVVWDMACGCGYGSRILKEHFLNDRQVVGFDFDQKALAQSRRLYGDVQNLSFEEMNLDDNWAFPKSSGALADMIVCFETLEFLKNRELFLMQMAVHLKPKGAFLFSTPCHGRPTTSIAPDWNMQQILYNQSDAGMLLRLFFDTVLHMNEDRQGPFPFHAYRDQVEADVGYSVGDNLFYCEGLKR